MRAGERIWRTVCFSTFVRTTFKVYLVIANENFLDRNIMLACVLVDLHRPVLVFARAKNAECFWCTGVFPVDFTTVVIGGRREVAREEGFSL